MISMKTTSRTLVSRKWQGAEVTGNLTEMAAFQCSMQENPDNGQTCPCIT